MRGMSVFNSKSNSNSLKRFDDYTLVSRASAKFVLRSRRRPTACRLFLKASCTRCGFASLLRPFGPYVRRLGPALQANRHSSVPGLTLVGEARLLYSATSRSTFRYSGTSVILQP